MPRPVLLAVDDDPDVLRPWSAISANNTAGGTA